MKMLIIPTSFIVAGALVGRHRQALLDDDDEDIAEAECVGDEAQPQASPTAARRYITAPSARPGRSSPPQTIIAPAARNWAIVTVPTQRQRSHDSRASAPERPPAAGMASSEEPARPRMSLPETANGISMRRNENPTREQMQQAYLRRARWEELSLLREQPAAVPSNQAAAAAASQEASTGNTNRARRANAVAAAEAEVSGVFGSSSNEAEADMNPMRLSRHGSMPDLVDSISDDELGGPQQRQGALDARIKRTADGAPDLENHNGDVEEASGEGTDVSGSHGVSEGSEDEEEEGIESEEEDASDDYDYTLRPTRWFHLRVSNHFYNNLLQELNFMPL